MSNNIDTSRFYQFLSNYKQGEKKLADTIDDSQYGNSDGTLIKGEFREFVKGEYNNWSGESKSDNELMDLANRFWSKIDTNTSGRLKGTDLENLNALDKDEEVKMEEKLGTYIEFNKYIDNLEIPSVLVTTGLQWKKAVAEELSVYLEQYIANGSKGDMAEFLNSKLPAIANKQTAIFCAVEYQNQLISSILSEYPDYKIADDKTLQALINKYVSTIKGDTKPEQIMEDIKKLVDAYLATAGIGNGNADDLGNYGYSQNESAKLNDIQMQKMKKDLLNALSSESDYSKYQKYYDEALITFLSTLQVKDMKTSIDELIARFKTSDAYKNIQTRGEVEGLFDGDDDLEAMKKLLQERGLSEDLTKIVEGNLSLRDGLDDLVAQVTEKVINGEFKTDKGAKYDPADVRNWVLDQMLSKVGNSNIDMSSLSVKDLKTIYDAAVKAAEKTKDLNAMKKAALNFCQALDKKGFGDEIAKVFGNDYEAAINELSAGEIRNNIEKLYSNISIVDDIQVTWSGEFADITMARSQSKTMSTGNVGLKDGADSKFYDSTQIAFSVTTEGGNGSATIDKTTGQLKIESGNTTDPMVVTVNVTYKGQVVATKKITVSVHNLSAMTSGEAAFQKAGYTRDNSGYLRTDKFKKLNTEGAREQAKTITASFVQGIAKDLASSGGNYDQNALAQAQEMTINYFNAYIDTVHGDGVGKKSGSYNACFEANGEQFNEKFYYKAKTFTDSEYFSDEAPVQLKRRTAAGSRWDQISVSKNAIINKFIEYYNKLIGMSGSSSTGGSSSSSSSGRRTGGSASRSSSSRR